MARGTLRIYLGAAPGVGKTYRMLDEGRRRAARGADVVVAIAETHGRPETAKQLGDLEVIPRVRRIHRGAAFEEMDLDAVLERSPQVALVDEFAHTNVPGSRNAKRWQDVEELLAHGIHVVSTLNVQHLESLNDVVREITGTVQRETVPDEIVRRAEQVELVDMAAQALRRRMAHGNIYPPEKVDAALAQYFREGNLLSLRELALLWTAGRVDEALRLYRAQHEVGERRETRERVVVALDGRSHGELLLRRGARIAERTGGELLAVHVARSDGLTPDASPAALAAQETLARDLGGDYQLVLGEDVARSLLEFARSAEATQLVLGAPPKPRLQGLLRGRSVTERTIRQAGSIDVHIVNASDDQQGRFLPSVGPGLGAVRRTVGIAGGLLALSVMTPALESLAEPPALQTTYLLYLTVVFAAASIGGAIPAAVTAGAAALAVNWSFTPPVGTFTIAEPENVLALVLFVVFALVLGTTVEVGARRRAQAARSAAEAQILSQLAGGVLRGQTTPSALLEQLRETFAVKRVALEERTNDTWTQIRVVGTGTASDEDEAESTSERVRIDDDHRLVLHGAAIAAADRRVLVAFAAQIGVALETATLAEKAAEADVLEQTDRVRTALLASVGHDLRTPLAGIKAAVSSLRQTDVTWSAADEAALLATIEESADRLDVLVRDLLDMTRLQAGAVRPHRRPVWLAEVLEPALADAAAGAAIDSDVPESLPAVDADPALLERILANLLSNAVRYGSGVGAGVSVQAQQLGQTVQVRIVDRGPGVPESQRGRMFEPFQRLDDRDPASGLGLGLAVARGFADAIGAGLEAEDTPGGGLTMIVTLAVAAQLPENRLQ